LNEKILEFVPAAAIIAGTQHTSFAETPNAPVFDSPDQAIEALCSAVKKDDGALILQLIGPLASSGDIVKDRADRELFIRKSSEMHRLVKEPDGTVVLYIGAENWPFPVPLILDHGKWHFDQQAGAQEITFRRVGENEMAAIETCRAIAHPDHVTENTAINDYARDVVRTAASPSESFHGYYFRTVRAPYTTVIVAYPGEYAVTGVMTFAVTLNGAVYEKDLGPKTSQVAQAMMRFKPDRTWHVAQR